MAAIRCHSRVARGKRTYLEELEKQQAELEAKIVESLKAEHARVLQKFKDFYSSLDLRLGC